MNILQAIEHPDLFAPWFKRGGASYLRWFVFLKALFALPMSEEELTIYREHTNRKEAPTEPFSEGWLVIGRRGGKSFFMALLAVYAACFRDYQEYLAPGERATVLVIAADKKQARVIMRYIAAMLNGIEVLKDLIEAERAESFDLTNFVTIEVGTASFRSTRGYTFAAVLCDEIAFWRSEDSANPDFEVLDAIRPGMATIPNALLMCGSSPYAKRGALYDAFKRFWGKEGAPLVWRGTSREMNPTVPQSFIDLATERDASSAAAEYLAQFRTDIEGFVTRDAVEACVSPGVYERAPIATCRYFAFVDPSGGSSDSMTLAIAHLEKKVGVLDVVREFKPPFSPEQVVADCADLLKAYRITKVIGDRYAGEWPREQFRNHYITYEASAKPKSDLYRDMLPLINSGELELLDVPAIVTQICNLERRVSRGGRDSIDHPPGSHDDVANAVAGVMTSAKSRRSTYTLDNIRL